MRRVTSASKERQREWFEDLRKRFLNVASRRVREEDVEDVVQDAMRIVAEKGIDLGDVVGESPAIAWCFQVLRNVIGNHYQKQATRRKHVESSTDDANAKTPWHNRLVEELDSGDTLQAVWDALETMKRSDPRGARYLRRLADGARPQQVAQEEGLEPAAFYRRLYRCRRRFREVLVSSGVDV